MQDKQFYSPSEVAHELGISSTTVLRVIHDGHLPALRVSERIYRVPAASFERYKSGTLDQPYDAALGPVGPRPRFGHAERIPSARPTAVQRPGPARPRTAAPTR